MECIFPETFFESINFNWKSSLVEFTIIDSQNVCGFVQVNESTGSMRIFYFIFYSSFVSSYLLWLFSYGAPINKYIFYVHQTENGWKWWPFGRKTTRAKIRITLCVFVSFLLAVASHSGKTTSVLKFECA